MPATRRRRLPLAGASSSRSHSHGQDKSILRVLNNQLNKWLKTGNTTGRRDHALKPPSSYQVRTSESEAEDDKRTSPSLSTSLILKALLSARVCSALWVNIQDCDEVFNYWEPSHFLLMGRGFQTWEYSPQFAIRSYFYVWFYTIPALIFSYIFEHKGSILFYIIRLSMALMCALSETCFLRGISCVFGPFVARICFAIQLFSTGMFISSTAFLPSSFSMYMTLIVFGTWMTRNTRISLLATLVSVLIGWPFAGIVSIPIGIHMLLSQNAVPGSTKKKNTSDKIFHNFKYLVKWTLILTTAVAVPVVLVDSLFYGKPVMAAANIVLYNVFSNRGPDLYGTEPWTFYPSNLLLNFNIIFLLSILCLPLCILMKGLSRLMPSSTTKVTISSYHLVVISSLGLWFLVFVSQAHKEERFMFPIFPLICLTGALSLQLLHQIASWLIPRLSSFILQLIMILLFVSALLSVSRGIALYQGYHAPLDIYSRLDAVDEQLSRTGWEDDLNLCVGKEWHRFPSSYFLPSSKWKLQFLKSEFAGLLPKPYEESVSGTLNRTRLIPSEMNDENREEMSRYISNPTSSCHFIIDTDYPTHSPLDEPYARDPIYEVVASRKFLDALQVPSPWRSFYVPFLSEKKWKFVEYNLLRNVNLLNISLVM